MDVQHDGNTCVDTCVWTNSLAHPRVGNLDSNESFVYLPSDRNITLCQLQQDFADAIRERPLIEYACQQETSEDDERSYWASAYIDLLGATGRVLYQLNETVNQLKGGTDEEDLVFEYDDE